MVSKLRNWFRVALILVVPALLIILIGMVFMIHILKRVQRNSYDHDHPAYVGQPRK